MAPSQSKLADQDDRIPKKSLRELIRPPAIPLERTEEKQYEKHQTVSFKLRTSPTDENSSEYSIALPYFNTGTPEQWLKCADNINKVIIGQNATTGTQRFTIARRVLVGDALATLEASLAGQNPTNALFVTAMNAVTTHVFPPRSLVSQKRGMRRFMRKPSTMKVRTYVTRLRELNDMLPKYPPFAGDGQKLQDDELKDLIESGFPVTWQKQFTLDGFDPLDDAVTLDTIIERAERIENTEDFKPNDTPKKSVKQAGKKREERPKNNNSDRSEGRSFKKCRYDQNERNRSDNSPFRKWEKNDKKEMFAMMDSYFKQKAKKEQRKATKEFAALSITPSSDNGSESSNSDSD